MNPLGEEVPVIAHERKRIVLFPAFVLALFLFVSVSASAGAAAAGQRSLPGLTVAVAADLHYIAPELTDGGSYFTRLIENADGKSMMYCEEITDAFLEQLARQKPDVLILAGDLTFNGARASHEALVGKLHSLEEAGVPVLVIPGNHDLYSTMSASFRGDGFTRVENLDADGFAALYGAFGYDGALARDRSSLSYTCEPVPGLRILMLDVNTAAAPGSLTENTFLWVREQLEEATRDGAQVLAVSHQNLLEHNMLFIDGFLLGGNSRLRELYEEFGVLCNLSGHMHIQHIGVSPGGVPEILTSALSVSPHQYGLLELGGDGMDYHTESVVFPHSVESAQFFWNNSYQKAEGSLSAPSDRLCRFIADINAAYFAGRTDRLAWDDTLYEEIWSQDILYGLYLQTVRDDGFQDQTRAHF